MPPTSLTLTPPDADWMAKAPCRGLWSLMDAETDADEKRAKEVCHACPVERKCGKWALSLPLSKDVYGVAAGMTARERELVRRRIRRAKLPEPPKRCTRCQETKPADQFYARTKLKGARDSRCRTCCAELNRERRAALKEAVTS